MPSSLPSLFVPHGSPLFALRPGAAGAAMVETARRLPQPRVVVVVSAHWDTTIPTVGFAGRPETIHDYYGFPAELYRLRYPATGCREAAEEVVQTLLAAGLPVERDAARGLDHGAWIPLRTMFPDADVPVVPLSIQSHGGPAAAWQLGRSLAPLVERGFLILASGNLTHNLADFRFGDTREPDTPPYVRRFADWFGDRLSAGDIPAVLDYRQQAPDAARAHPSDEHLLPLYVALGAAGERPAARRLHAGIDDRVLAMDIFAFEQGVPA
ncbi:MAG TPA: class III extradiol ring-cleavage dioxygenase [Thauera sp.]|nr:class III extradiol ring-cleavage dioxygenase [Thauera sp.]